MENRHTNPERGTTPAPADGGPVDPLAQAAEDYANTWEAKLATLEAACGLLALEGLADILDQAARTLNEAATDAKTDRAEWATRWEAAAVERAAAIVRELGKGGAK